MDRIDLSKFVRGRVRAARIPAGLPVNQWPQDGKFVANLATYDAAAIVANLLRGAPNGKSYEIGGLYVEFDNSGAAVSPPTYDRSASKSYYLQLNTNEPDRDYLRVPVIATAGENTDAEEFSDDNEATFYAQTEGAVGVHGLTFSDSVNSRVYGAALVAYLDADDDSQDLIFSRVYFPADQQIVKPLGGQVAITWPLLFG